MKSKFNLVSILAAGTLLISTLPAIADDADFAKSFEKYMKTEEGQKLVGSTVEQYFMKRREEQGKAEADREAADMESRFKNPVQIAVGSSPSKGPKDAKVTIVEFSDFQCPYCSRGKATMDAILEKYPKDVKLVFKNLPLPFHQQAKPAAKAALAAAKQGKFWEMHDALFENQQNLNDEFYAQQATKLSLDMDKFKKDLGDPEIEKMIKEDEELAQKNGISGTPGFFVNGVPVKGAYPKEHFEKIIDRWLSSNPAEGKKS